jgi:Holliday junction resolvasome RuvABC ATP-dependent DNA helicase subunit
MIPQREIIFFGPKHVKKAPAPSREQKLSMVDPDNLKSPFSKFIGNKQAIRKLQAAAFNALGKENHVQRDLSFAIFGPASSGKTTLGRIYADSVELPLVEISPKSVKTTDDLLDLIKSGLSKTLVPLVDVGNNTYFLPPMVIFIDEVHALSKSVVNGLLKATEFKDAILVTESGSVVDCHNVTWMIATTDEGKLFDAFRTRFSPVMLKYLSKVEMARIIKLQNPDLSDKVCALVSHYNSRIPRKALEFARYMRMVKEMHPEMSWEEVAAQVASDEGIDEHGMHEIHLKILRALGQGPIARNRISFVAGRKDEEVEKNILPWLLTETEDQPAFVSVSSRGYVITKDGIAELEKRGIPYDGDLLDAA